LFSLFVFVSIFFFFSSRRRHTRFSRDWSSDVCSSDLLTSVRSFHQFDVRLSMIRLVNWWLSSSLKIFIVISVNLFGRIVGVVDRSEERRVGKECRSW